jgi:hypothetical protein
VAYLLEARTVEPEKQLLLVKGWRDWKVVFSVQFMPRLYNEDQLPLQGSLETAVRSIASSLQGHEPRSRAMSTGEETADSENFVHAVMNCRACISISTVDIPSYFP